MSIITDSLRCVGFARLYRVFGIVAENIMAWRFSGTLSEFFLSCGRNPAVQHKIRSSMMSSSIFLRLTLCRSIWSTPSSNYDIRAALESLIWGPIRIPAYKTNACKTVMFSKKVEESLRLKGDLTRRVDNQAAQPLAVKQALGHGNHECGGLAGPLSGQALLYPCPNRRLVSPPTGSGSGL